MKNKVAIIGAGPSGLALAKQLLDRNISFVIYERDAGLGGVWNIQNKHSVMYDSAHTISSKTMMQFSEFPMPAEFSEYISHHQMLQYLQSYAEAFDLIKHIRFSTLVNYVEKTNEGRYQITLVTAQMSDQVAEEVVEFDHVAVATGHAYQPKWLDLNLENFKGEVIHSRDYKEPSIFKNKRVLIIGAGNSGCDIACDATSVTTNVMLSIRRGYFFIPKFVLGMPADVFGETSIKLRLPMRLRQIINQIILRILQGNIQNVGFPKPDHRILESHPIVNELLVYYARHGDIEIRSNVKQVLENSVLFSDGKVRDVDVIMLATGYEPDFAFLETCLQPNVSKLHLNLFSRMHKGLSFLGLIDPNGGVLVVIERQAMAVADLIETATVSNLDKKTYCSMMTKIIPLNGGINYVKSSRHDYEVDLPTYQREINIHIKRFKNTI